MSVEEKKKLIQQYILYDEEPSRDIYGHPIAACKCKLCKTRLSNPGSIYSHLKRYHPSAYPSMPQEHFQPIPFVSPTTSAQTTNPKIPNVIKKSLSPDRRALLVVICCSGLSLNMTSKEGFRRFINHINPNYPVPNLKIIRADMILFGEIIKEEIEEELKHKMFSFITDGGTVNDNHFYPIVLFTPQKLYRYAMPKLDDTWHKALAEKFSESLNKLIAKGSKLIACCTDNAANVTRATTMGENETIEEYTHQKNLRVSCGINTANLALKDLQNQNDEFRQFTEDLKKLMIFCRTNEVKKILKAEGAKGKMPKWMEIKWNIIHDSLSYVMENKAAVESCLTNVRLKKDFDLVDIPQKWNDYMDILKPFSEFIIRIQASHCLLYEFYEYFKKLQNELDDTILEEGAYLKSALISSFKDTADGLLAELSFLFTPKGLEEFRKEYQKFINAEESQEISDVTVVYVWV